MGAKKGAMKEEDGRKMGAKKEEAKEEKKEEVQEEEEIIPPTPSPPKILEPGPSPRCRSIAFHPRDKVTVQRFGSGRIEHFDVWVPGMLLAAVDERPPPLVSPVIFQPATVRSQGAHSPGIFICCLPACFESSGGIRTFTFRNGLTRHQREAHPEATKHYRKKCFQEHYEALLAKINIEK